MTIPFEQIEKVRERALRALRQRPANEPMLPANEPMTPFDLPPNAPEVPAAANEPEAWTGPAFEAGEDERRNARGK